MPRPEAQREAQPRIKLAGGDRDGAVADIEEALALVRSLNVMRFIGPWILGTRALVSGDAALARESLAEGMAGLQAGCVSHNQFWFCKHAMETCLQHGDFDAVEGYAAHLERFTAAPPTPWGNFFIARARTLARIAQVPGDAAARATLEALRRTALKAGHLEAMQGLKAMA